MMISMIFCLFTNLFIYFPFSTFNMGIRLYCYLAREDCSIHTVCSLTSPNPHIHALVTSNGLCRCTVCSVVWVKCWCGGGKKRSRGIGRRHTEWKRWFMWFNLISIECIFFVVFKCLILTRKNCSQIRAHRFGEKKQQFSIQNDSIFCIFSFLFPDNFMAVKKSKQSILLEFKRHLSVK